MNLTSALRLASRLLAKGSGDHSSYAGHSMKIVDAPLPPAPVHWTTPQDLSKANALAPRLAADAANKAEVSKVPVAHGWKLQNTPSDGAPHAAGMSDRYIHDGLRGSVHVHDDGSWCHKAPASELDHVIEVVAEGKDAGTLETHLTNWETRAAVAKANRVPPTYQRTEQDLSRRSTTATRA